jgi:hypothetical protein
MVVYMERVELVLVDMEGVLLAQVPVGMEGVELVLVDMEVVLLALVQVGMEELELVLVLVDTEGMQLVLVGMEELELVLVDMEVVLLALVQVDMEVVLSALVQVDMEGMGFPPLLLDLVGVMLGMEMLAAMEEAVVVAALLSASSVNRKVTLQKNVQMSPMEVKLGPPMLATVAMVVAMEVVVGLLHLTTATNVGKVATLLGTAQVKEEVEVGDMVGEALVEEVVMAGKVLATGEVIEQSYQSEGFFNWRYCSANNCN